MQWPSVIFPNTYIIAQPTGPLKLNFDKISNKSPLYAKIKEEKKDDVQKNPAFIPCIRKTLLYEHLLEFRGI